METTLLQLWEGKRGKQAGLLASLAFFAMFACLQSRKTEVIRPGKEFEIKIGQEAMIEGEGLAVVFESVPEDSRCPEGVDCIWSGNAKVKLRSSKQKQTPATIELNTNAGPKSSSYLNYEVSLVALKPHPKADKSIQPDEYKATLIVVKK
jgi:hypothetical protein